MTKRPWLLALMFLGGSLFFAPPVEAQRSGFIIGVGFGPGLVSYTSDPDRESKLGIAFDFHIGGVIGDSFELFFVTKANFFESDLVGVDRIGSGVGGLGFSYPLNPKFSISGGIGLDQWMEFYSNGTNDSRADGVGLWAGGRYLLSESERWALGFDIMYGKPFGGDVDFNALGVQFTINVLSH
jgi:hypothetical protein